MNDRIAYFSLETFPPEMLNAFARELLDEEKIVVRRLLPPLVRAEMGDAPIAALRSRIRVGGSAVRGPRRSGSST